jgi:lipoyl(octanoyl) transferase
MSFKYFKPSLDNENVEWKIEEKLVEYTFSLKFMEDRLEKIHQNEAKELIWILEHEPVYTLGTSGLEEEILDKSISVLRTSRGGRVTYHGPGQIMIYALLKMSRFDMDLKKYIAFLKQAVTKPLKELGIEVIENNSKVGLWVNHPQKGPAKIAFIGIRIRKSISFHGVSLNINPDLSAFSKIVPCGEKNEIITSLHDLGLNIN